MSFELMQKLVSMHTHLILKTPLGHLDQLKELARIAYTAKGRITVEYPLGTEEAYLEVAQMGRDSISFVYQ